MFAVPIPHTLRFSPKLSPFSISLQPNQNTLSTTGDSSAFLPPPNPADAASGRTPRPVGRRGRFQLMRLSPRLPPGVAGAWFSVLHAALGTGEAPRRASGWLGYVPRPMGLFRACLVARIRANQTSGMQPAHVWFLDRLLSQAPLMQNPSPFLAREERSNRPFFFSMARSVLPRARAPGDFVRGEMARRS